MVELVWPIGAAIFQADVGEDDELEVVEFILQPKSIGFECNVVDGSKIPDTMALSLISMIENEIKSMNRRFNNNEIHPASLKYYLERSISLFNNNPNLNTSNLYSVVRLTQFDYEQTNHFS